MPRFKNQKHMSLMALQNVTVEKNVHHIAILYNDVLLLISLLNAEGKGMFTRLCLFCAIVKCANCKVVNLWCLW